MMGDARRFLIIGMPTTGQGGSERDLRTIVYSSPGTLVLFIVLTLLVALPQVAVRLRAGTAPRA
jgi:hypothetical protein